MRPPTGANTCTTRVGSGSMCAGRSRYSGIAVERAIWVWMPFESEATISVLAESFFGVCGVARSLELPEPQPTRASATIKIRNADFMRWAPKPEKHKQHVRPDERRSPATRGGTSRATFGAVDDGNYQF